MRYLIYIIVWDINVFNTTSLPFENVRLLQLV